MLLLWLGMACDEDRDAAAALIGEVWFGDPHAHSGASGDGCSSDVGPNADPACGALANISELAADVGVDWVVSTDHVNGVQARDDAEADADWRATVDGALSSSSALVLAGAEVFLTTPGPEVGAEDLPLGHRSVIFFGDTLDGLDRAAVSPTGNVTTSLACADVQPWVDGLRARFGSVVLLPHHPAALHPMPTDWGCLTDADLGVELYSHWGNSRTWTSDAEPWSDYDRLRGGSDDTTVREGTVSYALTTRPDVQLGFFAGTDDHHTHPASVCNPDGHNRYGGGLTAVVAPLGTELTRDALYEAIVARHTYATTGPRIPLSVQVSTDSGGSAAMGDGLDLEGATTVSVALTLGEPSRWIDEVVIVNAVQPSASGIGEVHTQLTRVTGGMYEATLSVSPSTATRSQYVFLELVLDGPEAHPAGCHDDADPEFPDDTERIWTSPTWF